jgi:hypothetical protein
LDRWANKLSTDCARFLSHQLKKEKKQKQPASWGQKHRISAQSYWKWRTNYMAGMFGKCVILLEFPAQIFTVYCSKVHGLH